MNVKLVAKRYKYYVVREGRLIAVSLKQYKEATNEHRTAN